MKIVFIGTNDSLSKTIKWSELVDYNGKVIQLPDNPQNNLVFDPRVIGYESHDWTFDIQVKEGLVDDDGDDDNDGLVTFTTSEDFGLFFSTIRVSFRLYFRNEEDIPKFNNSVPYLYEGQYGEKAPYDAIEVKVKNNVTAIKRDAFRECKKLVSVDMADSQVEEIEDGAFYRCESLKHVRFPKNDTLKKIGESAFWECRSIEERIIPRTVTNIATEAFFKCEKMKMCDMADSQVETIQRSAFYGCESLKIVRLPKNSFLKTIGKEAFRACKSIEAILIPPSVTSIKWKAFSGCGNLSVLKLPNNIELNEVDDAIIDNCEKLNAVIPADTSSRKQWLKNRYNEYPLHETCYNVDVTVNKIKECIEYNPDSAKFKDDLGMTALHLLSFVAPILPSVGVSTMIQCIFDANKDAALTTDKFDRLPFCYTIKERNYNDQFTASYLRCSASYVNVERMTALHHLVTKEFTTLDMVQELFKLNPVAVTIQNMYGYCPLHYAVCNQDLVKQDGFGTILLDTLLALGGGAKMDNSADSMVCPASIVDGERKTALHYLSINKNATVNMVQKLYKAYPDAVTIQDNDGYCPLHYAVCNEGLAKQDGFESILIKMSKASGTDVLCPALVVEENGTTLVALDGVEMGNSVIPASIVDGERKTALHYLSENENATVNMVQTLYKAYPDAVTIQDNDGYYPLQHAVYNQGLVKQDGFESILIKMSKASGTDGACPASVVEENGSTALHYVANSEYATTTMVKELFNEYPKAASIQDNYGNSPLHYAVSNEQLIRHEDFKSLLVTLARGTGKDQPASLTNNHSMSALHLLAGTESATAELIQELYKIYPHAATIRNVDGHIPIHFVAMNAKNTTVHDAFRTLALHEDQTGNCAATIADKKNIKAIGHALTNEESPDHLTLLLYSLNPMSRSESGDVEDRLTDVINRYITQFQEKLIEDNPIHSFEKLGFIRHIIFSLDDKKDKMYIDRWVKFFRDVEKCPLNKLKLVAGWKDEEGRKVSEYAVPRVKKAFTLRLAFLERYEIVKGPVIHKSDNTIVVQARDLWSDKFYGDEYNNFEQVSGDGRTKSQFEKLIQKMAGKFGEKGVEQLGAEFDRFDESRDKLMQQEEFIQFCRDFFDAGQNRLVALKFMRNKDQFEKEINVRDALKSGLRDFISIVVDVENYSRNVTFEFEIVREAIGMNSNDLEVCHSVLVMPFGDRNLDSVYRFEQPDLNWSRSYVEAVCMLLKSIHSPECNICHSDLVMKNIVRIRGHLKLIDMDAAATIPNGTSLTLFEAEYYVGSKFSSGILPPEMIAQLNGKEYEEFVSYFAHEKESNPVYWEKIEPRASGDHAYVVKTFKTYVGEGKLDATKKMQPGKTMIDMKGLPYTPVLASAAIDLWSLGVLLYTLLQGRPLFDVDRNDDLIKGEDFEELYLWTDKHKNAKLVDVKDAAAWDLLNMLLSKDPDKRGNSMSEVLEHVFFKTGGKDLKPFKEQLDRIEENQQNQTRLIKKIERATVYINRSIEKSSQVLMKAVFEANEVTVPTCFILHPSITQDAITKVDAKVDEYNKMDTFFKEVRNCIADFNGGNLNFTGNETEKYSLYLIDEYTGEKVGDPYPVNLTKNKLAEYVPIMLNGLRVMKVASKVAAIIAKSLFPPLAVIPTASKEIFKSLEDHIKKMDPKNPQVLANAAASEDENNVRGAPLREFEKFLRDADKDGNFRGMKRVCDRKGNAMWVTEESYKKMKYEENNKDEAMKKMEEEIENLNKRIEELTTTTERPVQHTPDPPVPTSNDITSENINVIHNNVTNTTIQQPDPSFDPATSTANVAQPDSPITKAEMEALLQQQYRQIMMGMKKQETSSQHQMKQQSKPTFKNRFRRNKKK